MTIVGKEMTPTAKAIGWKWDDIDRHGDIRRMYSKMLMTKDFQFTKIIFQMPGQGAMEMPMNSKRQRSHTDEG